MTRDYVVYAIECVPTGFGYVGCTAVKLNRRFNEHMSLLRKRKHTSIQMLIDWDGLGRRAFKLKVLERLPPNASLPQRREAELRGMDHYAKLYRLYNAHMISYGPGPAAAIRSATPESREKRSLALKGKPKHPGHGPKVSATKKALGQRPTLEAARMGGVAATRKRYSKD